VIFAVWPGSENRREQEKETVSKGSENKKGRKQNAGPQSDDLKKDRPQPGAVSKAQSNNPSKPNPPGKTVLGVSGFSAAARQPGRAGQSAPAAQSSRAEGHQEKQHKLPSTAELAAHEPFRKRKTPPTKRSLKSVEARVSKSRRPALATPHVASDEALSDESGARPAPVTENPTDPAETEKTSSAKEEKNSGSAPGSAEPGSTPIIWDEDEEDPLLDTVLADRYRIKRRVGEGGMGVVYEAEHVVLEKRMALKVLSPELTHKKNLVDRFIQEAKAASRIGHENIVDITDFGTTPTGTVFFAMEFLEGMDLAMLIDKEGPLAWQRARPIVLQICRALSAAHAKGIIHRDMKPENIFLIKHGGRQDFVKVVDFGIAKVTGMEKGGRRLTKTGMIFGTPDYMSPEQASGQKPDHRIDIYSLGVILYEMLTGKVPFTADSFMGILTKHMFEEPRPPSQMRPDLNIAAEVDAVVLRAMCKDRDKRYGSMSEFAAAIQQCESAPATVAPHGEVPSPRDVVLLTTPKKADVSGVDEAETANLRPRATDDALGVPKEGEGEENTDVVSLPVELPKSRNKGLIIGGIVMIGALAAVAGLIVHMNRRSDKAATQTRVVDLGKRENDGGAGGVGGPAPKGMDAGARLARIDAQRVRSTGPTASDGGTGRDAVTPVRLSVITRPARASVYLDGKFLGTTPLEKAKIPRSDHKRRLLIKRDGYRTLRLEIVASRDLAIRRKMRRRRGGGQDARVRRGGRDDRGSDRTRPTRDTRESDGRNPDLEELKKPRW
jgi:serine/threonine protein kinase